MKKVALVFIAIGLLITIFTGISFITKEKIVDVGSLQITKDKKHNLVWSPFIGVGLMVVGGVLFLFIPKKQ